MSANCPSSKIEAVINKNIKNTWMSHRSDYRTPVRGLYLCGSGAHPGGGVMGASCRNAAHVVLHDIKSNSSTA